MANNRYFQWIVGENRGQVMVLDSIDPEDDMVFLKFKNGSRINIDLVADINVTDLTGKMMAEVEGPHNIWSFREQEPPKPKTRLSEKDAQTGEQYEIPDVNEVVYAQTAGDGGLITQPTQQPLKKKIDLIPPRPTRNAQGRLATTEDLMKDSIITPMQKPIVQQQAPTNVIQQDTSDPVYIMMNKAKKVETEVEMSLTVSLPSKSLYNVAEESFDDGGKKVIEYIINNMDMEKIKDSLKVALREAYGEVWPCASDERKMEMPQNLGEVAKITSTPLREGKERGNKKEVTTPKPKIQPAPQALYEPEVIEEPVIRDATEDEIPEDIKGQRVNYEEK